MRQQLSLVAAQPRAVEYDLIWTDSTTLDIFRGIGVQDDCFRLRFWGGMSLDVDYSQRSVADSSNPPLSESVRRHLIDDLVMPRIYSHDGEFAIHAGAVRVGDEALLFLGESGRGKSTLVTKFDLAGYPLLGDDAVIVSRLGDGCKAETLYPSLRLLPDSLKALLPSDVSNEAVSDQTGKRRITGSREAYAPLPIRSVFILGPPTDGPAIGFRRLAGAEACMCFIENSFALDPTDRPRARKRMEDASWLASRVPAFEVTYKRDYEQLSEVVRAILHQSELGFDQSKSGLDLSKSGA